MSSIPESMLLTTKKPTFRGMLSNRAGKLLKQLSKSMSGNELDGGSNVDKAYSESTTNDDASEEPVEEVKDFALETAMSSGDDQGAVEAEKPREQQVAEVAVEEEPESAVQAEAVAAGEEVVVSTMNGNGVHASEEDAEASSSTWQVYRRARLAKVAKSIYLFALAVGLVSLYMGDVGSVWSQAWTSLTRDAVLRETPALTRGGPTVLEVGDFMYSCRPAKEEGAACQPTVFYLRDDGALVLARGKSPSSVRPEDEVWTSKAAGKEADGGEYTALYSDKGILMVRDAQGRTVWRRRPIFTPRFLRPWPLSS